MRPWKVYVDTGFSSGCVGSFETEQDAYDWVNDQTYHIGTSYRVEYELE